MKVLNIASLPLVHLGFGHERGWFACHTSLPELLDFFVVVDNCSGKHAVLGFLSDQVGV